MNRLEHERLARGWTKAELAVRACVNVASAIEATNGRRRPAARQLGKLALALGWPLDRADELLHEVRES